MARECTQAEWKILELLWENGGMTAGQVIRSLQTKAGWTQHAVCTLMERMKQKELIKLEESESGQRYVCKLSQEQVSIAPWALEESLLSRLKNRLSKGGKHQ